MVVYNGNNGDITPLGIQGEVTPNKEDKGGGNEDKKGTELEKVEMT